MQQIFSRSKKLDNKPIFSPSTLRNPLGADSLGVENDRINGSEQNKDLKESLYVVFKYRSIIIAVTLVCFFAAVLYCLTAERLYTAQTKIKISSYAPVLNATNNEDVIEQKTRDNSYLETQIQEIESYTLADKVLIRNQAILESTKQALSSGLFSKLWSSPDSESIASVQAGGDNGYTYRHSLPLIKKYLDYVSVVPLRRTSLVAIQATHPDPALAVNIANQQALSYIDWVRSSRIEEQSKGLIFLSKQADELRERVADLEREIADYAEANSIVALNKDQNITVQKMSQLNQMLTASISKKIEAQKAFEEALTASKSNSAGVDDNSVQSMRSELAKLEAERDNLSQKFTARYPRMQQIDLQIKKLKSSIAEERQQIVSGLKARAQAAEQSEKEIEEELNLQKSQTFELSKRQVQYNILNRELISTRDLLQSIIKQAKETSLAVESNASNISVVDYAIMPREPSSPRVKLTLVSSLFLGLLAGLVIAYVLHYLDNSVRGSDELRSLLQLTSLGVVPDFKLDNQFAEPMKALPLISGQRVNNNLPLQSFKKPRSLSSEAYRAIRTALVLSKAGSHPRTILLTSAKPGEGKTTTAVNLAYSLTTTSCRVCLIDADMRRPSVARYFNLSIETLSAGLSEILTQQADLKSAIIKSEFSNLDLIHAGSNPPNPAELLGSKEMANMLDILSKEYDYILIDSPPVIPVTDSVVLSRLVDGVVMVVRSGETPKRVILEAKQRLKQVGAKILGAVLNGADKKSNDYYYYNSYYGPYIFNDKNENQSKDQTGTEAVNS